MVKIAVFDSEVYITDGVLTSSDSYLQRVLRPIVRRILSAVSSPSVPDIDQAIADSLIERFGGELLKNDHKPRFVEGRIY